MLRAIVAIYREVSPGKARPEPYQGSNRPGCSRFVLDAPQRSGPSDHDYQ
jgi:hypothetical protein